MVRQAISKISWLSFCLLLCVVSAAQQPPQPTELPGHPFYVKKIWRIGGEGNWDYLTLDANTSQLFVAHGIEVQVVDVSTGTVIGEIKGLRNAHGIALDEDGQFGYISDGGANQVRVFDRNSLQIVASVPTGPNPRAILFEPINKLVFAICAEPITDVPASTTSNPKPPVRPNSAASTRARGNSQPPPAAGASGSRSAALQGVRSVVTVIDAETHRALANLLVPGKLGFAQTDGRGRVFINITDRNQIAHFNAQVISPQLAALAESAPTPAEAPVPLAQATSTSPGSLPASSTTPPIPLPPAVIDLDWTGTATSAAPAGNRIHTFNLGQTCPDPRGLAVDGHNQRIFAACDNRKLDVLDAESGSVIATLPIGVGTDAVGYDASRGLIYTANGGGDGSVSIIRQHLSDSYALIQELPTFQRARTLAVNQQNGEVYLVTNKVGVDLKNQGGIGDLKMGAVEGSFEVLVIAADGN